MRRVVGAALGLLLLTGCRVYVVEADSNSVSTPTTVSSAVLRQPMMVYGEPTRYLMEGIAYWNGLSDDPLFKWGGPYRQTPPDNNMVTIIIRPLAEEELEAYAAGTAGSTPIEIHVDPEFDTNWNLYGHELGHALGLDDYNTGYDYGINDADYAGIMSYPNIDAPSRAHDRRLLNLVRY